MRIAIVSDDLSHSWSAPRRAWEGLARALAARGHIVDLSGPAADLERTWDAFQPEAVHVATGGPAGCRARRLCLERGMPFSTQGAEGGGFRPAWHRPAARVFAADVEGERRLWRLGFGRGALWAPGVDAVALRPERQLAADAHRPLTAWAGGLDEEGPVRLYLESGLAGTQFVLGDGSRRRALAREFPGVRFVGNLPAAAVGALLSCVDALVHTAAGGGWPYEALEALSCGTPVASLPDRCLLRAADGAGGVVVGEDLPAAVARAAELKASGEVGLPASRTAEAAARAFVPLLTPGTWWVPYDAAAMALAR